MLRFDATIADAAAVSFFDAMPADAAAIFPLTPL